MMLWTNRRHRAPQILSAFAVLCLALLAVSLAALGGPSTYRLGGAMNCGKGQPGQSAPVSHGCPAAVFSGVRILNTRAEAGR